jgi:hypothetical protein
MRDYMTHLANKAHPEIKRPIKFWQVKVRNVVYFEHNSIQICWNYIRKHGLDCIPKAVY